MADHSRAKVKEVVNRFLLFSMDHAIIYASENLYSPHMVVRYNKNSNGTKTKEKQWQCNVNANERTCILRPDHVKKSTQLVSPIESYWHEALPWWLAYLLAYLLISTLSRTTYMSPHWMIIYLFIPVKQLITHNLTHYLQEGLSLLSASDGHCWMWLAPEGIWYGLYSAFLDDLEF